MVVPLCGAVDVSARTQGFLKHLSVCGAHPPRVEVLTPTVFEKRKDVVAETLRVLDDADGNEGIIRCPQSMRH